jgi:hypothetical protein
MTEPREEQVEPGDVFHPGEIVPASGIYECDAGCGHQYSTDVEGHRFPPMRAGCAGKGWKLLSKTPGGSGA